MGQELKGASLFAACSSRPSPVPKGTSTTAFDAAAYPMSGRIVGGYADNVGASLHFLLSVRAPVRQEL
jgi:hypothetical protein